MNPPTHTNTFKAISAAAGSLDTKFNAEKDETDSGFGVAEPDTIAGNSMFLKLPGELRNKIHDYVFSDQVYEIRAAVVRPRSPTCFTSDFSQWDPSPHVYQPPEYLPLEGPAAVTMFKHSLALPLTCRQLYDETRLLPFQLSTFSAQKLYDIEAFYSRMTASRVQLMSSLEIRIAQEARGIYYQLWDRRYSMLGPHHWKWIISPMIADIFRGMTGLKRLYIYQPSIYDSSLDFAAHIEAIINLQLLVPNADVTGDYEAIEEDGTKRICFLKSIRGMGEEERSRRADEAIKALGHG
jgi:hypothetical protein